MPNIRYRLSTLRNPVNGKCEILAALTYGNGKRLRAKTRIYTSPERWNADEERIIIPRNNSREQYDAVATQRRLNELSNAIMAAFMETNESHLNKAWLVHVIAQFHDPETYADSNDALSVTDAFAEYIDTCELSEVRKRNTSVVYRIFCRFVIWRAEETPFSALSADFLTEFAQFCRDEHIYAELPDYRAILDAVPESRKVRGRGENSVIEIMRRFRTFVHWAMDKGYLRADPFRNYKIEQPVYGTPYYITLEERDAIANCDLSARPALAVQRDIFVFQCCIGCRVGDFMRMTKNDVVNGAIEYIPQKTIDRRGRVVRVPLNSIAREIYERYADSDDDRLLPFISEQKYNAAIKEIFRIAGVVRPVTVINPSTRRVEKRPICDIASSHLARRTFVGNLYKQAKDLNLVCALSGHTAGSKAVARYYEVDEEMRRDLVAMLE